MPFKPGQSGNPNGRRKGPNGPPSPPPPPPIQINIPAEAVPYVSRIEMKNAMKQAVEAKIDSIIPPGMKSPLAILMEACNDKDLKWDARISAANAAAPYVHRRQPQAVEIQSAQPPVVIAFGVPSGAPQLLGLLPRPDIEAIAVAIGSPEEAPQEGV